MAKFHGSLRIEPSKYKAEWVYALVEAETLEEATKKAIDTCECRYMGERVVVEAKMDILKH